MSGPQGNQSPYIDEVDFSGASGDAFADVNLVESVIRAFMVMKNTDGANALQWQVLGIPKSGGAGTVVYGPVTVTAGNEDFANVEGGPYAQLKVQVKSDVVATPANYSVEESILRT